jgi:DNA polymerase III subunit gamma/tau
MQYMTTPASNHNLAVRHRPGSFSTVIGQRHVVSILRRAVVDCVVPQQILFSGGSGLGKTTIARILAAALLCKAEMSTRESGEACSKCSSCIAIAEDRHPDLIEFDAASNGSKDEIREIAARAQLTPLLSTRRIYIIDEAHGLSQPGGQAFLKLLEEPPAHVSFMLCTTDPQKMLKTNRGRCTEFELLSPTRTDLVTNLQNICRAEGWSCPVSVLEMVVDSTDLDLGVRGTVNTLSKLSTLLGSGDIDDKAAETLLGRASTTHAKALLSAVCKGKSDEAWQTLSAMRLHASDEAIRAALLDAARNGLIGDLQNPTRVPVALAVFERVVTMPKGRNWLDLFALGAFSGVNDDSGKIVEHPQRADASTDSVNAPSPTISSAPGTSKSPTSTIPNIILPNSSSPLAAAGKTSTDIPYSERILHPTSNQPALESSTVATPTSEGSKLYDSNVQGTSGVETEPAPTSRPGIERSNEHKRNMKVEDSTATNQTARESSSSAEETPTIQQPTGQNDPNTLPMSPDAAFVSAVAKIDPDLAGALRRCQVTVDDSVRVRCSAQLKSDLEKGVKTLRLVAGRAGLPFELAELSDPL